MTDTILTAGVLFIGGLIAELFAVAKAPMGYQDDCGFHIGTQTPDKLLMESRETRAKKLAASSPRLININLFHRTGKSKDDPAPLRRCRETIR